MRQAHCPSLAFRWAHRAPALTRILHPPFVLLLFYTMFVRACRACQSSGNLFSPARSPLPFAVFDKQECATSHLTLSNNTDLSTSLLLVLRCGARRGPHASSRYPPLPQPSPAPGHLILSSSAPSLTAPLLLVSNSSRSSLCINTDTLTRPPDEYFPV